jgi:hypothetical protein
MSTPIGEAPAAPGAAGISIEGLTRRLIATPNDFLTAAVDCAALVSDLFGTLGIGPLGSDYLRPFRSPPVGNADKGYLGAVAVGLWLLYDPQLLPHLSADNVWAFLRNDLLELAKTTTASALVDDPDRREELARRCLRAFQLRIDGETEAQADDRLASLNSFEQQRLLEATRAAELRAAEVRRAMHEKVAAEAAAKASRE